MTVYFTLDADGHKIAERAHIRSAASYEAALAAMKAAYADSDFEVVDYEPGAFGDCWIKAFDFKAVEHCSAAWTAEAGELIVQSPGEHPGGRAWWITPADVVLVPVFRERGAE